MSVLQVMSFDAIGRRVMPGFMSEPILLIRSPLFASLENRKVAIRESKEPILLPWLR